MVSIPGWKFEGKHGFSGSTGHTVEVKGYRRGGPVKHAHHHHEIVSKEKTGIEKPGYRRGGPAHKDADAAAPVAELAKGGRPAFHLKKGALHKDLHVKQGEKIPEKKLEGALHSKSPLERKRAQFAENAKHFRHAKGGHIGPHPTDPDKGAKGGPDLDVYAAGNHLAFKKGGKTYAKGGRVEPEGDHKGGKVMHRAMGGMTRPMGMPRAPVIGMKRTRHPGAMPGSGRPPMPSVPGLPAAGTAPMGIPGASGSPPRVMRRGGRFSE